MNVVRVRSVPHAWRLVQGALLSASIAVFLTAPPLLAHHKPDHEGGQGQGNQGQQGQGNQGQGNQGQQGQGNQGGNAQGESDPPGQSGNGSNSGPEPPTGDPLPPPEVRLLDPPTNEPGPTASSEENLAAPPVIEIVGNGRARVRVHASPPGDVHRVHARIGRQTIELTPETDDVYSGSLSIPTNQGEILMTVTANYGSTTASVKSLLRPRVAGAETENSLANDPVLNAINWLHRLTFSRNPTYAEWRHWANRVLQGEKRSVPELYGAMQWSATFARR